MKKFYTILLLSLSVIAQAQPSFDEITIVDANIFPSDAVVDASGNTYIIGTFAGDPDFDPGTGVVNAPDPANYISEDNYNDAFIAEYNADGTLAWVQVMWTRGDTGGGNDPFIAFRDIVLDDSGNVFFVGDLRGVADGIGNQVKGASTIQGGDSPRAFARGLSPTGSIIFQGVNSHVNLSAGSTGNGIDVDASGNVYITGEFDFDVNGFTVANSSNKQTYYTKFNSSGTRIDEGYLVNSAVATYDVNRDNGGKSIAVNDDGSFIITGYFGQNAAFDGSTTLSSVNQKDTYVAYYNASEALLDVKTFSTAEEGRQVALDGSGNLYLSYGTNITRITNTGTTDWTRDFSYDVSFSINSSDDLIVTRLNEELRYLKLLSDNTIDFEVSVPFITGTSTALSSIKAFEYAADNYTWVMDDIQDSNFDGSAPFESGNGIVIADYSPQTDFAAPTIQTRTPGLNATSVPLDQVFTVEFDEPIVLEPSQGIVSIAPTGGGGITNLFEGNPGISSSGNTLTFSTSDLVASTNYEITLLNIQDDLGNEIATTDGWFITTGTGSSDETPPQIISLSPVDDATNVPVDASFVATFNEAIAITPGESQAIILYRNGSPQIIIPEGDSRINISDNVLTINFNDDLLPNTNYAIWLKNSISDLNDNINSSFNNSTTWNFTTAGDITQPSISSRLPEDDALDVPLDQTFSATFDEPIVLESGQFIVNLFKNGNLFSQFSEVGSNIFASGSTLTFTIPGLENATDYSFQLLNIQDAAGNEIAATNQADWSFTTIAAGPQLVSFNPLDDAVDVALDADLVATFNEDIQGSVDRFIEVRRKSDGFIVISGPTIGSPDQFTVSGNSVTIHLANVTGIPVTNSTEYYVQFNPGAIQDQSGNFYEGFGFTDTNTWTFTTAAAGDTSPPTITSFDPTDGATGFALDGTLTATFSEPIQAGTGTIGVRKVSDNSIVINGNATGDTQIFTVSGSTLSIDLGSFNTNAPENGTEYFVEIFNNAVLDAAGNGFEEGFSDNATWNFTTASNPIVNIPDEALKAVMVSAMDSNTDGEIQVTEAEGFTGTLNCFNQGISDATGIESLTNALSINLTSNNLTSVDLSGLTTLVFFSASSNDLSSITLPSPCNLATLNLRNNQFTSIDIPNAPNLIDLNLENNAYTTLDVSSVNSLETLRVGSPNLSNLTIGTQPCLNVFSLNNSDNIDLDLSSYPGISNLTLAGPLNSLNLTGVSNVDIFVATNDFDISTFNFAQQSVLSQLSITNSPSLTNIDLREISSQLTYLSLNNNTNLERVNLTGLDLSAIQSSLFNNLFALSCVITDQPTEVQSTFSSLATSSLETVFFGATCPAAPTDILLDNNSIADNNSIGDVIGSFSAEDENPNDTFTFNLVSGTGSTDNNSFTIDGNNLIAEEVFNFTTKNSYSIRVSVNDGRFNFEKSFVVTITSSDNTAPIANSTSPSDEGTFAPLSGGGGIVFNEAVQQATGTIELYLADGTLVESIPTGVDDSRLEQPADFRITWDFDTDLIPSTDYYILVSEGAYEDLASNPFAGLGIGDLDFTSNSRPEIELLTPKNEATDVAVDAGITLDLNENVEAVGAISLVIREYDSDNLFESFDLATLDLGVGAGSFLNGTITADPSQNLANATKYYVVLEGTGSLSSLSNAEAFQGLDDKDDWTFTTISSAKEDQTITFNELADKTFGDAAFDLTATASSNLTVSYSSSDETVATVNGSTVTIVGAGSTTIIASQEGDNTFNTATPVEQVLTINKADQTITIEAISDKLTTDAAFDVVASTTSNLSLDYSVTGPATNNGSTITLTSESGTVTVTVSQAGNGNYNEASESVTFNVTDPSKTDQTITFNELEDKTFGDAPFNLTATASSNLVVSYESSNQNVATIDDNTVTIVGAGSATINATQQGDDSFNAAAPVAQVLTINKADQTISIESIGDKLTTDEAFDVVASATSNLELEYDVSGPATNNGSTITLSGESGVVTVTISQAGNDNYNQASESVTFNVTDPSKTDQTITFEPLEAKMFEDAAFDLTATASSNLEISYTSSDETVASISGSTVTIVGAGSVTITASQEGNESFNPATSVEQLLTVNKADQTISIESIGDKLTTDEAFDVVASTTSNLDLSYQVTGPASIIGNAITLNGDLGTVKVTVSQSGNANFNAASASESFEVTDPTKEDQSITFDEITDKVFGDAPFSISATASSDLAITFSVVSGPITLNGNEVTITGAGTAVIVANQEGNEDFNAAEEVTQTFEIAKADQVIAIESIEDKLVTSAAFEVVASVDSELALTYEVSGPATIEGTTISLTGATGTVTVTVSQEGNENYNEASATETFEISEEGALAVSNAIEVKIYPNPAADYLHIESKELLKASIINLEGKTVKQTETSDARMDISDLSSGTYLLILESQRGTEQVKFVKQN